MNLHMDDSHYVPTLIFQCIVHLYRLFTYHCNYKITIIVIQFYGLILADVWIIMLFRIDLRSRMFCLAIYCFSLSITRLGWIELFSIIWGQPKKDWLLDHLITVEFDICQNYSWYCLQYWEFHVCMMYCLLIVWFYY